MQNSISGGSLSVSRYLTNGVLDAGFALHGSEVVSGLGAGISYTGVAAQHPDQRFIVALAARTGCAGCSRSTRTGRLTWRSIRGIRSFRRRCKGLR
jgi:hypothetical protein